MPDTIPRGELPTIAAKRGKQTLVDALIAAALVFGLAPLAAAVGDADGWRAFLVGWQSWTWQVFQGALVAAVTALISWARRRYVDDAGVKIT